MSSPFFGLLLFRKILILILMYTRTRLLKPFTNFLLQMRTVKLKCKDVT